MEIRDHIHTLAVYMLALLLVSFSRKKVQQMLDKAADMTEAIGGRPRPYRSLAAARARGRTGGRPSVITPELLRAARDMLPNPENSIESIAKLLGVSAGTLYNHIPDLRELRASRVPRQLEGSPS